MKTKFFLPFLFMNALIALFLVFNPKYKETELSSNKSVDKSKTQTPVSKPITMPSTETKAVASLNNTSNSINSTTVSTHSMSMDVDGNTLPIKEVCFDKISASEKTSIDSLLTSIPSTSYVVQSKTPQDIYWNLGANETVARATFDKQKNNGIMNSEKFKLSFDGDNWIVPISTTYESVDVARNIATEIAQKAQKVNAGGKWQYKTKPNVYFLKLTDQVKLNKDQITYINSVLSSKIVSCTL